MPHELTQPLRGHHGAERPVSPQDSLYNKRYSLQTINDILNTPKQTTLSLFQGKFNLSNTKEHRKLEKRDSSFQHKEYIHLLCFLHRFRLYFSFLLELHVNWIKQDHWLQVIWCIQVSQDKQACHMEPRNFSPRFFTEKSSVFTYFFLAPFPSSSLIEADISSYDNFCADYNATTPIELWVLALSDADTTFASMHVKQFILCFGAVVN